MNKIKLPTPDQTPATVLGSCLNLKGSCGKGIPDVRICELSAHTYLGETVAKLNDIEIATSRHEILTDLKATATIFFANRMAQVCRHISEDGSNVVKAVSYMQTERVEIILHAAPDSLRNFMNIVAQLKIDFPFVNSLSRTAA